MMLRSFAWGPTGLLSVTDFTGGTPQVYTAIKDATGSVVQLIGRRRGTVAADYHYDAWGDRTAAGPAAAACPFGLAGMYQDASTGLYFDHARWYSAWQQADSSPETPPASRAGSTSTLTARTTRSTRWTRPGSIGRW